MRRAGRFVPIDSRLLAMLTKLLRRLQRATHPRTTESTKSFEQALLDLNTKILNNQNFALSRFGDGEMIVINGESIDLSEKYNGEHKYTPGDKADEHHRALLADSLSYRSDNYFVGIACPCCVGKEKFFKLKEQSRQPEEQLTWANLFVNSNYARFKSETVAALSTRKIVIVCHQRADLSGLAFPTIKDFRVGSNAWTEDYQRLLPELVEYIENTTEENSVFIFCAGVLSNILIAELHRQFPQHTYLDVGSVFDVELALGKTRKYLKKGKTLRKTCIWL